MLGEEEQMWEDLVKQKMKSRKMKMPNEVGPLRSHFDVQWKPKKINAKTRIWFT